MKPSSRRLILSGSVTSILLFAAQAPAANWVGGVSNDWNNPLNWDTGAVPTNAGAQNAYIGITGGGNPPFTATISADVPQVVDILVARTGGPAVLNHIAGTAATGGSNWLDVGTDGGTGTYNLANTNATGGTLTGFGLGSGTVTAYRMYVGGVDFNPGNGGTGTVNMNTSGSLNTANDFLIGVNGGTGVFNLDAGTVNTGTGGGWNFIGTAKQSPGAHGTLNMSGGTINNVGNGRTYLGDGNAWGQLNMTGGTYNNNLSGTADYFAVGVNNLSNANASSVSMSGGTINSNDFYVGGNEDGGGRGTLTMTGAAAQINAGGQMWVGDKAGGNGLVTLSAGAITTNNWFAVGRNGATGVVNMTGGSITKNGNGHIIVGSLGGNGTINQSGGLITSAGHGDIRLGENASVALWDLSGGTAAGDGVLIGWSGGTNEFRVRGTGTLNADHIEVGEAANNGSGVVNQTGGSITANQWIAVGLGSSVQAQYNVSSGTTTGAGLEVGADSSGLVTLSGNGVMHILNAVEVPTRNGSGTFNISGGTLTTPTFMQGGRDGQVGTGATNQSGGLVQISGDLIVQRPNVGTGSYALTGGTLSVDGNINLTAGTFNFNGGKITRSNSGVITVLGNLLTGSANATLKLDADKTFNISGALTDTAGLTLDVTGLGIPDIASYTGPESGSFTLGFIGGTVSPAGDAFDIGVTNVLGFDPVFNIAGFGNFAATRINQGDAFDPNSQSVYWVNENAGTVTVQYSAVPEPGTAGLLGLGALGLGWRRRRKK